MKKVTTINFTYETNGTDNINSNELISMLIDNTEGCVRSYSTNVQYYENA